MQQIRIESDSGAELTVGAARQHVSLTAQATHASVALRLNAAQAQLLARALMQAATALAVCAAEQAQ
jgi:hypothetical protein